MQSIKVTTVLKYLMLTFAILPVLIVGTVGYFSMMSFSTTSLEQYVRFSGAAQSEVINQCIGEYGSDVTYLALNSDIYTFLTGGAAEDSDLATLTKSLLTSAMKKDNGVLNVVLFRTDNVIAMDAAGAEKKEQSGASEIVFYASDENIEKLSRDKIYVTPIYAANEYYDEETFCVIKCVQDEVGNKSGYVAEVISTSRLSSILANTSYGDGGYLAVTDGSSTILNFEGINSQKIDALSDSAFQELLKTTGSTVNATDYSAGGYIGSYGYFSGLAGSGWKWISVYPANAASSQILMPILISLGAMVVLALICAILGQLVNKSIVGPIKSMIANMNEIKDGDREKRIEVKTSNEFRDMAELFNGMLDEVCMSEELHRTISDISDNMLFEWDFHKEMMYVSENFKEKFDIDPSEAQLANGKFLDKLMTEEYSDVYKRDISTLLKNKTGHSSEYQMVTRNGSVLWFSVRAMCITDRLGEPLRVIGVVTDIDSEKKMELQLSERASYDFLSQLYNRSTFERELKSEIERNAHTKVAVVFIDVDDFKFINDRFGHSVGDEVIKYVSGCIKKRVQGSGFAGRFGGDEFVLCVTDPDQINEIESLSLDLIDELYSGYQSELANAFLNVKASIGIAISPEHGENGAQLIAAADEAMYFVKKNGKANYHIFQPEDSQIEGLQHTL